MLRESGVRELLGNQPLALRAFASLSLAQEHDTPIDPSFYTLEAQLYLIRSFYLPDESIDEVRSAIQGVMTRDETNLLYLSADGSILFVV